ncbi:hypothetical protein EI555_016906 [Monodon monoceros]|nr:hypothetical protein EI555_016906 [Monodon monoceros]
MLTLGNGDKQDQRQNEGKMQTDKMQRLCAYVLILVLALATFSEATWKPRSHLQDAPLGPGANRDQEPRGLGRLGPASHHRRQLGLQGPSHLVADLSKKQGPWVEEEEEAYGWMDFGRRSAEEGDLGP